MSAFWKRDNDRNPFASVALYRGQDQGDLGVSSKRWHGSESFLGGTEIGRTALASAGAGDPHRLGVLSQFGRDRLVNHGDRVEQRAVRGRKRRPRPTWLERVDSGPVSRSRQAQPDCARRCLPSLALFTSDGRAATGQHEAADAAER